MSPYFLTTPRIGFRHWTEHDLPLALGLWGDPLVTQFISATGIFTPDQIRERLTKEIANHAEYGIQYWPIFLLANNEHIGCCGLRPYNLPEGIYEIGFHICSDHWRHGYAIEAAQAAIDYAFNSLNASSLFAGHNPRNTASRHLLTKLGFTYTHDEYYAPTGLQHPSYLLQNPNSQNPNSKSNPPIL